MECQGQLLNYIDGAWQKSSASEYLDVIDPGTAGVLAQVPMSTAAEVERAVAAAAAAFDSWRRTPAGERIQYLFELKRLIEGHIDELARTITMECGKTFGEAKAEFKRGLENIEVACGIPAMMQGYNSEDIAPGIDEIMIRQPVGVVAAVTPFNFPGMIPLWFLPYALACGNPFILKPSEQVPLTMQKLFELVEQIDLPKGVLQLVNGGKAAVDVLLDHPAVRAISFVGSTPVARYIYRRAAEQGKRAQCQGGAKNPVVIMPDADLDMTVRIVADSAYGCAGQRCLACSTAIAVGAARQPFADAMAEAARQRKVGYGLDPGVEMGPVISSQSRERIEGLIQKGLDEGGRLLVDGRGAVVEGYERGAFLRPSLFEGLPPRGELQRTEIFGPVFSLLHCDRLDDAIALINDNAFGNMACIFTASGAAARQFRYEVRAGNIGVNLGVAAPMAFFPFTGWKESFLGDLHGQGWDAIEFNTEKKVVIERWPDEWSRRF